MKNVFNLGNGLMVKNKTMRADVSTEKKRKAFEKAQYVLDSVAFTDMVPYMPMVTGSFFKKTQQESQALAGTGWICAGAGPQGRYLYNGIIMVDQETGSPWAKAGHRKVLTDRRLQYTGTRYRGAHPKVTDHWFIQAKKDHGDEWLKLVKKNLGAH